ncbi:hypothetical protein CYY_006487 [Polysphondylium violaceum]|uniref:Uncharacterized protein n=1 Tax=Polysphondylium violaceum TaxID=133409 RepID=A0A8J4PQ89_9MYCE|nr:hypothetical protein CYY_006487 [Polysphondylium violaceum]
MIFKALSNISNPLKSLNMSSSQTSSGSVVVAGVSGSSSNACWYIIAIGGPTIWVEDNASPHKYYFGYPPSTSASTIV